jgi:predicted nucleic acid-binding protein
MKLVLDTNIILYHLGGRLVAPLPQQAMVSVSVIPEMEVLSYPALTEAEETTIRCYLANLAIINLTEPIKQTAISLRRQYKLNKEVSSTLHPPVSFAHATSTLDHPRPRQRRALYARTHHRYLRPPPGQSGPGYPG